MNFDSGVLNRDPCGRFGAFVGLATMDRRFTDYPNSEKNRIEGLESERALD
jgi:hypothetical protein